MCHDEWGPEAPARSGTEPPREAVSRKGAGGLLKRGREGLRAAGERHVNAVVDR
jgi:hypothetical protein